MFHIFLWTASSFASFAIWNLLFHASCALTVCFFVYVGPKFYGENVWSIIFFAFKNNKWSWQAQAQQKPPNPPKHSTKLTVDGFSTEMFCIDDRFIYIYIHILMWRVCLCLCVWINKLMRWTHLNIDALTRVLASSPTIAPYFPMDTIWFKEL